MREMVKEQEMKDTQETKEMMEAGVETMERLEIDHDAKVHKRKRTTKFEI